MFALIVHHIRALITNAAPVFLLLTVIGASRYASAHALMFPLPALRYMCVTSTVSTALKVHAFDHVQLQKQKKAEQEAQQKQLNALKRQEQVIRILCSMLSRFVRYYMHRVMVVFLSASVCECVSV